MNNLFTWCHGPLILEVSKPNNKKEKEFTYNLKIQNTSNGYSKSVKSERLPQIDYLKECFTTLNSRNFKQYGCLVDVFTIPNLNNKNIIKSFRHTYRTTVTTDEERLGTHYIDLIRYDYNFKLSEFEPEKTESTYSIVFGFTNTEFPSFYETIEIGDLDFDQISEFIEKIHIFINE